MQGSIFSPGSSFSVYKGAISIVWCLTGSKNSSSGKLAEFSELRCARESCSFAGTSIYASLGSSLFFWRKYDSELNSDTKISFLELMLFCACSEGSPKLKWDWLGIFALESVFFGRHDKFNSNFQFCFSRRRFFSSTTATYYSQEATYNSEIY